MIKKPRFGAGFFVSDECPLLAATSIGQRNILFSNYKEGDVEYAVQTENLLHGNRQGLDVGSLAERRFTGVDCPTF